MKKILIINYSQTGQLTAILDSIKSTINSELSIEHITITPKNQIPFPWTKATFFNAMPETVLNKGIEINDFVVKEEKYDLIVLGYQPWFLSMSLPTSGLFKKEKFTNILKNTPIITVIGARNMWINAQNDCKAEIKKFGGRLIGNIPLIDRNSNLLSAVTIMHWMFKGRKDKKWNIFPKPGISDEDISNASCYGTIISSKLLSNELDSIQTEILKQGKISIKWNILFIEARAKKLFRIWAKLIDKKGTTAKKRKRLIIIFRFYLVFALFIVSPIILTIYFILFRIFNLKKERFETNKILNFNN